VSLVDFTKLFPAIDEVAFPGSPSGSFWSSSPVAGFASNAWIVDFYSGNAINGDVSDTNRVRCVR
jgi:hypothetical protein